jgi:NAD(P)H-dependent FMN reductase
MQHPTPTLIFAGSTRAQSYNRQLARVAANMATEAGAQVTVLELADLNIPLYNADLEARGTPPDVMRLKALLHDHPAWIICSPEYNGGMTALLKNTLDWASSPVKGDAVWDDGLRATRGKVVGMLSASPGAMGGLRGLAQLAPLLLNLQCWVAPRSHALGHAAQAFTAEGTLAAADQATRVKTVVGQVLWAARALHEAGAA